MHIDDQVYKHRASLAWAGGRTCPYRISWTFRSLLISGQDTNKGTWLQSFCKHSQYVTPDIRKGNAQAGSPLQPNGHYTSTSSLYLQKGCPASLTEVQAEATGLLSPQSGLHSHPSEHLPANG